MQTTSTAQRQTLHTEKHRRRRQQSIGSIYNCSFPISFLFAIYYSYIESCLVCENSSRRGDWVVKALAALRALRQCREKQRHCHVETTTDLSQSIFIKFKYMLWIYGVCLVAATRKHGTEWYYCLAHLNGNRKFYNTIFYPIKYFIRILCEEYGKAHQTCKRHYFLTLKHSGVLKWGWGSSPLVEIIWTLSKISYYFKKEMLLGLGALSVNTQNELIKAFMLWQTCNLKKGLYI